MYNNTNNARGGLFTYRQFMLRLPEDVTPAEAERQYNAYRQSHAKLVREEYFRQHSHESWLHAQFHPSSFEVNAPALHTATRAHVRSER
jgi:hypothetical protein